MRNAAPVDTRCDSLSDKHRRVRCPRQSTNHRKAQPLLRSTTPARSPQNATLLHATAVTGFSLNPVGAAAPAPLAMNSSGSRRRRFFLGASEGECGELSSVGCCCRAGGGAYVHSTLSLSVRRRGFVLPYDLVKSGRIQPHGAVALPHSDSNQIIDTAATAGGADWNPRD